MSSRGDGLAYTSFDILDVYEAMLNKVWYEQYKWVIKTTFLKNLGAADAKIQSEAEQSSATKLEPYVQLLDSLRHEVTTRLQKALESKERKVRMHLLAQKCWISKSQYKRIENPKPNVNKNAKSTRFFDIPGKDPRTI